MRPVLTLLDRFFPDIMLLGETSVRLRLNIEFKKFASNRKDFILFYGENRHRRESQVGCKLIDEKYT